jgi:hypothetical protein
MVQRLNKLSDVGGLLIAEGLKSNCSVTAVHLVSYRLSLLLLFVDTFTCVQTFGYSSGLQNGPSIISQREITESIQKGQGYDKGVAVACQFFSFESCEYIDLSDTSVPCFNL